MEKVYRSKFTFDKFETYVIYGLALLIVICAFFILNTKIYTMKFRLMSLLVMMFCLGMPNLILLILWNIKIIIKDNGFFWKRIDKTVKVKWDEVKKIEKLWRPNAGIAYYIVTQKGRLNVPRNIENYQDLFKEIENHTKQSVKWGL